VFGSQLDALPKSYAHYLVNGLREAFDLPGVLIRVSLPMGKNPFDKRKAYFSQAGAGRAAGTPRAGPDTHRQDQTLTSRLFRFNF
jgi:hypothetical protein